MTAKRLLKRGIVGFIMCFLAAILLTQPEILSSRRAITSATSAVSIFAKVPGIAAITTDADGFLYALSRTNNTIMVFDPVGSILKVIGPTLQYGYRIEVPKAGFQPLHVDHNGRIYIVSNGVLLILDRSGELLNSDDKGVIAAGFRLGFVTWIGTTRDGRIYTFPSVHDDDTLVTVMGLDGTRVTSFGDRVFPKTSSMGAFRLAIDREDNLYALFAEFAGLVKYGSDGKMISFREPRLDLGFEDVIASRNLSLNSALQHEDAKGAQDIGRIGRQRALENIMVFFDVKVLRDNSLLCLTGDHYLIWYDTTGRMVRSMNVPYLMYIHGSPVLFYRFAVSPDDRYAYGIGIRDDNVYRIDLEASSEVRQ